MQANPPPAPSLTYSPPLPPGVAYPPPPPPVGPNEFNVSVDTVVPDVIVNGANILPFASNVWNNGDGLLAMDYLPYFSACEGTDSYIYLWQARQSACAPLRVTSPSPSSKN